MEKYIMIGYKSSDGLINIVPVKNMSGAYFHVTIVCKSTLVETYSKSPIALSRIESQFNVCIDTLFPYQTDGVEYEYNKFNESKAKTNIYFLQSENNKAIKIGSARCVESRIKELQTGNPETIKLIHIIEGATIAQEKNLHKKFSKYHIRGEWFSPEIYNKVKELNDELQISQ